MSKNIFFVGPEHHLVHIEFTKNLIGGEVFFTGSRKNNTYNLIRHLDSKDVNWFFADLYSDILPHIKGKAVYIPHGLGPKPYLVGNETRVKLLKENIAQVWLTGALEEPDYLAHQISEEKICRIGYTPMFAIPDLPVKPNSVFVSCGWFEELMPWDKMLDFIQILPQELDIYVSTHPSMPQEYQQHFINLCNERPNLTFVGTEEEMMQMYGFCSCAIVGLSSVVMPFFYFGRPVIFLKRRNRFPFFQWTRLRKRIYSNVFFKVLSESTKFIEPKNVTLEEIKSAKVVPSAKKMFYPTNWDRKATESKIKEAVAKLG